MKLAGRRIESFLSRPDPAVVAILVYGPDAGLVRERLDRLAATVVADLGDPFRISDIGAAKLKDDPARLGDEAAALALTGGRRVVRLREAGDTVTGVLKAYLSKPTGDALILIEAGELSGRSSLRKLAEEAPNAAALGCYADDDGALEAVIVQSLKSRGLAADPDALVWLVENLGGDRLVTRSELEKLTLYVGASRRVSLDDAMTCIGDSSALVLDALPVAVADGNQRVAQPMLARLYADGTAPVAVLRSLQRHFMRLHAAAAAMAGGQTVDQAMAGMRPPPHFTAAAAIRGQLQRWPLSRLSSALETLLSAEIDCKTTGLPAKEICGRVTLQLARVARKS